MHLKTGAPALKLIAGALVVFACAASCAPRAPADAYRTDCGADDECVVAFYDACAVCPEGAINSADQSEMRDFRRENSSLCVRAPVYGECAHELPICRDGECTLEAPNPLEPGG